MGGRVGKFHYVSSFEAKQSACGRVLTNGVKITRNRERVNCDTCLAAMARGFGADAVVYDEPVIPQSTTVEPLFRVRRPIWEDTT